MIVDAHVHIFPEEVVGRRADFLKGEPAFAGIYEDPRARLGTGPDLIESMSDEGLDSAIVCGFPWRDRGKARAHNDYILEMAGRYGSMIVPLACVDPLSPGGLTEARRALSQGAAGLGELAFYDRDFSDPAVHDALVRLGRLCAEADRPLLIHTNEPIGHEYPGKAPMTLRGLYEVIRACPETRFQLAHLGGGLFFYELLKREVHEVLQNCVYDTAAAPFLYHPDIYAAFASISGEGRLLYGSDWPLLKLRRYLLDITSSLVIAEQREQVLGQNAVDFWELT